jgi:hypothetical protein
VKKIKLLKIIVSIFIVAVFSVLVLGGLYGLNSANYYDKLTMDEALQNREMLENFGCLDKTTPTAYGFENYEDIKFISPLNKKITLSGWYIRTGKTESKEGRKLLLITEGRWVNRLKAIKYLELIKNTGLDELYDIYIGDMRNAGDSSEGNTGMGYNIAEDIAASLIYLNQSYGNNSFAIWGFSQSGMAAAILSDRKDLQNKLATNGVVIEKMILDSPISNTLKMLKKEAEVKHIPQIFIYMTYCFMHFDYDFYAGRMHLGKILEAVPYPFLILQSKQDQLTLYSFFEEESKTFSSEISVKLFDSGAHVSSYLVSENKQVYEDRIKNFLNENGL